LLYIDYEVPIIYDSFEMLDTELTEKKRKRKRELADKGSAAARNDGTLDSLPVKGKNRLEDEVILLNKREAWKRKNEEQLEEVAFGKDMRNSMRREGERLEKLTEADKRGPIDDFGSRRKREDVTREIARGVDRSNDSHIATEIGNGGPGRNLTSKEEDRLRSIERAINVFVDDTKTGVTHAATIVAATKDSVAGNVAINAVADHRVNEKPGAVNCRTEIDKANGSASFVNLTSDTEPGVSKERRKVPVAAGGADDNAVKLNRAMTSHRSEEAEDPEVELKNLRQQREGGIYGVADRRTSDLLYNDDNLPRNKLRGRYVVNLDEPDVLDPENNLVLLRIRNKKRSNDVAEWKLMPMMRRSLYRDASSSLTDKRLPASSSDKNTEIDSYADSRELWRLRHRGKRNGVFNISPVLRLIDNEDSFLLGIPLRRAVAGLRDSGAGRRTFARRSRKLFRPRNNRRSSGGRVAEFKRLPSAWRDLNRRLRNVARYRDASQFGDQAVYDDYGLGLGLPVWPYHRAYYVDLANSPMTFPFISDLEYGQLKERGRDRRVARSDELRPAGWKAADFSDNSTNESSRSGLVRQRFPMETNGSPRRVRESGEKRANSEAKKHILSGTEEFVRQ
jgi:hypothetical protein